MAEACRVARAKLARATHELAGPSSLASRASTAMRAGYIGGVKTPLKGVMGNLSWAGFKALAAQPLQAKVDYVRALKEAAQEGKGISPIQYREVINGTNLEGWQAFKRGWKQGTDEIGEAWKAGKQAYRESEQGSVFGGRIADAVAEMKLHVMDANKAASLLDYTPTQYKNPFSQAMADASFLLVESVDHPFYYAAEQMSLTMQARLAAMKAGAKTRAEINTIAEQLLKSPSDDMKMQASFDAHHATFKDRGVLAKTAEQGKRNMERWAETEDKTGTKIGKGVAAATRGAGKVGQLVSAGIMPFTGVPTSVATKGMALTPVGFLSLFAEGQTGAQQSAAIANALLGTGGVILGVQWADKGWITGKLTAAERAENPELQEYSINVGGKSIGLQTLGPIAVPLFAGAALSKQHKKDPQQNPIEDAMGIARSVGEQSVNSTYAQGLKQAVDAVGDENKSLTSIGANLVPVPSLVTQASRAIDPQPREARGFVEKVANKTPLSMLLPPATSATGQVRERTALERAQSLISPFNIKEQQPTVALDELARLGVKIGKPAKVMQAEGNKVELTPKQMLDITTEQGQLILPMVEGKLKDPEYLKGNDEQKADYWESVIRAAKAKAKQKTRLELHKGFLNSAPSPSRP